VVAVGLRETFLPWPVLRQALGGDRSGRDPASDPRYTVVPQRGFPASGPGSDARTEVRGGSP
jgi:hypothetical protein